MKANGKVIIVTGAGSGMGREITLLLLKRGAKVAAVDINQAALTETATMAGASQALALFTLNIADKQAVEALPAQVIAAFGAVDGVINNAGIIQPMVMVDDLNFDLIEKVMAVNFWGPLYLTKALLPHLKTRPVAHIVNVSSMGGFLPVPSQTIYGASKAAIKLLTEGLHSELATTNVKVTVVFPGAISTNIAKNSGLGDYQERMSEGAAAAKAPPMTPAPEAARIIVDGMEQDAYRVLVGKDAKFMDFLYRLAPKRAAGFIFNQMKSILGS